MLQPLGGISRPFANAIATATVMSLLRTSTITHLFLMETGSRRTLQGEFRAY